MRKFALLLFALLYLGINTGRGQYTILYNFPQPSFPAGSLTLSGKYLYGMTEMGGVYGDGVVFSIDTNGNNYQVLLDFNGTNGANPTGDLTCSSGVLYGMAYGGGIYNDGCVFSIDINGSNYKDILDFNDTNGKYPNGSLILSGNKLFGVTTYGGREGYGCLFSISTKGTFYKDLCDFASTGSDDLWSSVALSGNKLFGMTQSYIFSIDTNGKEFKVLVKPTLNGFVGTDSHGSFTMLGNKLYAMSAYGGIYQEGNVFSIDTNGSGYKDLFDLTAQTGGHQMAH